MAVRIVTDSSCDLTDDEVAAHGIEVVPLTIRFGDEEFEDRAELTRRGLLREAGGRPPCCPRPRRRARASSRPRSGARPTAGADAVVCINLSVRPVRHDAVGPERGQGPRGRPRRPRRRLAVDHLRPRHAGAPRRRGRRRTARPPTRSSRSSRTSSRRTHVFGALDTLDNLKKGGRIGGAQALLGSLLSIKPILDISTGEVEEAGKARTRRKALEALRDKVVERGRGRAPAASPTASRPTSTRCSTCSREHFDRDQIRVGHIGPVIGTHGGPRVMGVTWLDPA